MTFFEHFRRYPEEYIRPQTEQEKRLYPIASALWAWKDAQDRRARDEKPS